MKYLSMVKDKRLAGVRKLCGLMRLTVVAGIVLGFTLAGCASYKEYAADRTARLRQMYPTGMSKEQVQAGWGQTKPDFSASRPANGWDAHPDKYIAKKLIYLEANTGKKIESVDRYSGVDGFFSLCYCWYFYDSEGRIVDVEWQYMSD